MFLVGALATIDMRSGEWAPLLPESDGDYNFSFSPGDEYLAYARSSGSEDEERKVTVGVVNMEDTRQRQEFKLDGQDLLHMREDDIIGIVD